MANGRGGRRGVREKERERERERREREERERERWGRGGGQREMGWVEKDKYTDTNVHRS